MRRIEKNITEKQELEDILNRGEVIHLAMADENGPYVVPMNYGYRDGTIYLHCAPQGRKIDMITTNPRVSFNVTVDTKLFKGINACAWTYHFMSVTGFGRACVVTEREDVINGLDVIMEHYGRAENTYTVNALERVVVLRIDIDELTGKRSPAVKKD